MRMRWLIIALLCFAAPASAFWQSRDSNYNVNIVSSGGGYSGPGDVFSAASSWYSCSRAYSASYAAPGTNGACDVVDTATGLVTCTFHIQTSGFVNPTECNATACATACSVIKAYDQTGNGYHMLQSTATLAQLPHVIFSSTPLGTLPAINCGNGTNIFFMQATTSPDIVQPYTMASVYIRNNGTGTASGFLGGNGLSGLGGGGGANLALVYAGSLLTAASTDNAWHALSGLMSGASSAINVDGSDASGPAGTNDSNTANTLRLCRSGSGQFGGIVAEVGIWAKTSNSTNRGNLYNNQHSSNGYGTSFP